jgi:signal transduction histidine kinase
LSEGTGRSSPQIRNLGQLLASFPFPEEEWALLVHELQNKPNDELLFLENQLNLLFQVRSLQQSLLLGRELALSTLAYTRPGSDPIAFPQESLKAVQAMTRARVRRHHITLYADITESPLAIFQGHLMQIMLNLVLNAIDAVQTLNPEDRWIRILARANADHTEFTFQNGGPCIPPDVQAKLFQRGFSTKGSQGSGIGLHVSSKLAREAHGNLTYDGSAPNPCFILLLPAAREDKVEAAS